MYWYERETGVESNILSTRVRFARNLEDFPFPSRMSAEDKKEVFRLAKEAWEGMDVMAVPFDGVDGLVKEAYVQTRLSSTRLAACGSGSGLILSRDGEVSLMINEEDHIRLQVIMAGKELEKAYEKAILWVKYGEERLKFSYRENLGYLTSCPTNLGAAMRISVMIHLPATSAMGLMPGLTGALNDAGYTVRGLLGEGSGKEGEIYQISNQRSKEKTPSEILKDFTRVIGEVEKREEAAREALLKKDRLLLEDSVSRALGILKFAKKMSYGEFVGLYSRVRFGRELGLSEAQGTGVLDRLFIELGPAPMLLKDRTLTDEEARDRARSEILREKLK